MKSKVLLLLFLTFITGCTTYYSPSSIAFPWGWGEPPQIQTKDYVPLPYGYGHGSSTLKKWIELKTQQDEITKSLNNLR